VTAAKSRASYHASPLRYPGGKAKLTPYFKTLIRQNGLLDSVYVEPFAGGGGVGLSLLLHGYVNRIVLNDLSIPIYAFWKAILEESAKFQERILDVPLTQEEWWVQKKTLNDREASGFDVGFATFYLNRTNHSGVLNAGMIGGRDQRSAYGLDARFNRQELVARAKRIARLAPNITVMNMDAAVMLKSIRSIVDEDGLIYIDPPYYRKGRDLYYDFYNAKDHAELRNTVVALDEGVKWVVSYDNVPEITTLYEGYEHREYDLSYSVRNGRVGREVMFFSKSLKLAQVRPEG
jgi:DNA adenine methylase